MSSTPRTPNPSPSPGRRRRPKHPARRTRIGVALGATVATLGLAGGYWVTDLAPAPTAAATTDDVTTVSPGASPSASSDEYDDDDDTDSREADGDRNVDITPSVAAPDTSSRAS